MSHGAERGPAFDLRGTTVEVGGRAILDGIELSIPRGEQVAIIGPSGAGKTTLLRVLSATLWPDGGTVSALGLDPTQLGGRALRDYRRRVGFLRQQDNLIAPLRVAHNVLMGQLGRWSTARAMWNLVWPRDLDLARAALARVELADRLWSLPDELSGGEQQRVAIARLIVQDPEVLLADEPVSALDMRLGREVITLLSDLARERKATLVVSLHSLDLLDERFGRIIALRAGRIAWQGSPRELSRAVLQDVYGAEYRSLHLDDVVQA